MISTISAGKSSILNYILKLKNNKLETGPNITTKFCVIIRDNKKYKKGKIFNVSVEKRGDIDKYNFIKQEEIKEDPKIFIKKRNNLIKEKWENKNEIKDIGLFFILLEIDTGLFEGELRKYSGFIEFIDIPGLNEKEGDFYIRNLLPFIKPNILFPILMLDATNFKSKDVFHVFNEMFNPYLSKHLNDTKNEKIQYDLDIQKYTLNISKNNSLILINKLNLCQKSERNEIKEDIINTTSGKLNISLNLDINLFLINAKAKNLEVNKFQSFLNYIEYALNKGDLKVQSASEAAYLSALATGGTSETFVLDGSVHVQNLHGTTAAEILNSTVKNAENISVNAGNAKIKPSSSKVEQDKETSELKTKDERDAKEKILNIIATGALAQQAESVEQGAPVPQGSTGAAIGADVNVSHSDRTVRAKVDGSTITATEDISVNSETKNQTINVAFAGSFAGGVSIERARQEQANNGQQNDNQQMQNVGNWMDILENARADEDDPLGLANLFDENNPNHQGAQNAQNNAGNIDNQNNNVDNDGNINPNAGGNNGNNPGNNNGNLGDGGVGANEARNNFSLAAAGCVNLYWDKTTTESVLTNSTVNVGNKLDVKAKNNNLYIDLGGGIARSGNIGAGAAVNIFNKGTTTRALIGDETNNVTITYKGDSDKELNVIADDKLVSVGVAVGVGMTKKEGDENNGIKLSGGGSFNGN